MTRDKSLGDVRQTLTWEGDLPESNRHGSKESSHGKLKEMLYLKGVETALMWT